MLSSSYYIHSEYVDCLNYMFLFETCYTSIFNWNEVNGKIYWIGQKRCSLSIVCMCAWTHPCALTQIWNKNIWCTSVLIFSYQNVFNYFIYFLFLFSEFNFAAVEGRDICSGNIEAVPTKEKSKFPQDFFPEVS